MYYFIKRKEENFYCLFDDVTSTGIGWCKTMEDLMRDIARGKYRSMYENLEAMMEEEQNPTILYKAESLNGFKDTHPELFI